VSTVELQTLERFCLGWPWHEPRCSAALACELIQWARGAIPSATELTAANTHIDTVIEQVQAFVRGEDLLAQTFPDAVSSPSPFTVDQKTRLYWHAVDLGHQAVEAVKACNWSWYVPVDDDDEDGKATHAQKELVATRRDLQARWSAIGQAVQLLTEFLRKYATQSMTVGAADGIGNVILTRIGTALACTGTPPVEIHGRMLYWRMRDALGGAEPPVDIANDVRAAFEAAWMAGKYEFAYGLVDSIAILVDGAEQ